LFSIFFLLMFPALLEAAKLLEIFVIDTEGGKALLIVSPSGQSMLVDTGFPGNNDRDTNRIVEAVRAAGIKKLDFLVVTHYDLDHVNNSTCNGCEDPGSHLYRSRTADCGRSEHRQGRRRLPRCCGQG
jgi:hypothetical protein